MMTFDELRAKYPRLLRRDFHFMCHEGWSSILDRYFTVVDRELPDGVQYTAKQIKEKLGTLRIYDSSYDEPLSSITAISEAHALATARSLHTCEVCGQRGRFRRRLGYLTVTCDEHAVRYGVVAVPDEPEPRDYRQTDDGWQIYDPDVDAFVASEPPDWLE